MAFPLWILSSLQMGIRQKAGLATIFCLALLVIIFDIIRTIDSCLGTAVDAEVVLWNICEACVAVLISCLPVYGFLLSPKAWKRSSSDSGPRRRLWVSGLVSLKNGVSTRNSNQVSRRAGTSQHDDDVELFRKPDRPVHTRKNEHDDMIYKEDSNSVNLNNPSSNGKDALSSQTNVWSPDRRDDLGLGRLGTAHIGLTREVEVIRDNNP